ADRNRSHWSTSKTPSYTKSVSWQHHRERDCCLPVITGLCKMILIKLIYKNFTEAELFLT
ncbi:hypothetical protein, partial [Escherichia coli]|uniref:hypothetical protein n=1 Tax=Escherichia coli TaxID=562 RepID=UPI00374DAB74